MPVARDARACTTAQKFIVTAKDTGTDAPTRTYSAGGIASLDPPTPTSGPTRIDLTHERYAGAAGYPTGSVLIRTPDGWPRTSRDGATVATFGPLPVDGDCNVNIEARPVALAARTLKGFVARETYGVLRNRSVGQPLVWAMYTAFSPTGPQAIKALAIEPVAHHRFGGVRIYARFTPACTSDQAHDRAIYNGLRRAVRAIRITR